MIKNYLFFLIGLPFIVLSQTPGSESAVTTIHSTLTYQGFGEAIAHKGTGEYKIYYDNIDGVLDRPVIFVDGFDPGDDRDIPNLYNQLNYGNPVQNLAEVVRDQGFDLIVLNFPTYTSITDNTTVIDGGADFIQRNAFVLIELLDTINGLKSGAEQNVVIGPSMGGLISRYALRYMEQNTLDHDTRLYLSFDSPHLGANVSIGLQYTLNYLVNGDPANTDVQPLVDGLLNSAAAKQMLIDHYLGHLDGASTFLQDPAVVLPTGAPNFRDAFQSELDAMGFPENSRNVSMVNGSGLGVGTGTPGMSLINHTFDTGLQGGFQTQLTVAINFAPLASQNITVSDLLGEVNFGVWLPAFSFSATASSPASTDGIDSAPGGQFDLGGFDDGTNPLLTEFVNNLNSQYFNFIPTLSGLAITGTDDWYALPNVSSRFTTPFDNTYIPDANELHTALNDANVAFALNEIYSGALSFPDLTETFFRLQQNPVSEKFTILNPKGIASAHISLFDVTGKSVYHQSNFILGPKTTIPLQLQPGIYILNITTDSNRSFRTKLLVK